MLKEFFQMLFVLVLSYFLVLTGLFALAVIGGIADDLRRILTP